MSRRPDADSHVRALASAYARRDRVIVELRRTVGLRVALPMSFGLFLGLGFVLFGDVLRSGSAGRGTLVWALAFPLAYAGAVALHERVARRRVRSLRDEARSIERFLATTVPSDTDEIA